MFMTKEEAAKKWCPMTRGDSMQCIASGCACWRMVEVTGPHNGARYYRQAQNPCATREEDAGPRPAGTEGWEFCPAEDEAAGWVEPQANADKRCIGYCGLAGKPHGVE